MHGVHIITIAASTVRAVRHADGANTDICLRAAMAPAPSTVARHAVAAGLMSGPATTHENAYSTAQFVCMLRLKVCVTPVVIMAY